MKQQEKMEYATWWHRYRLPVWIYNLYFELIKIHFIKESESCSNCQCVRFGGSTEKSGVEFKCLRYPPIDGLTPIESSGWCYEYKESKRRRRRLRSR